MSKLFHCRCAVAINFARSDKIIAFDESHIEDVRVDLSGFTTAFGTVIQGTNNPTFPGGRYANRDNTVSVTLNETVLDASWLALLDVAYTQGVGGKAIDFIKDKDKLENIYGIDPNKIGDAISVKASQIISDSVFSSDKGKALILEAQGKGDISPNTGNPQEEQISKISDPTIFKDKLKEFINKAETTKDSTTLSTAKKQIGLLLTAGRKNGLVPDIGGQIPPSITPPQSSPKPPPTQPPKSESYGTIVLAMDHSRGDSKYAFGAGADGNERSKTDIIAQYLKSEIERKEPKIKVKIVTPDNFLSDNPPSISFKDSGNCEPTKFPQWNAYDNYIVKNYIENTKAKATIISVHLDAPKGGSGGSGARVWNLENATSVSNKLTNVINGTYINKFKEIKKQQKTSSIGRWPPCKVRSVRVFQNAPEGYALLEFGVFQEIKNVNEFISDQKEALNALIDGLIQFKKNNGTSNEVPDSGDPNSGNSPSNQEQNTLPEIGEKPGILISFWYDVNNYISKVDYYFIITSASVQYGDGPPRLNINGISAFSIVFNSWKIQDSFSAGSPIDEVLKKVFSSDPTGTFKRDGIKIDRENPKEKLYEQEDLAGLTYSEFKNKLATKFDLQFLSSARVDQLGKIKIFREARGGFFNGSQVFWLGRGLFEKFDISVVSDYTAFNAVSNGNSSYSNSSSNTSTSLAPGSPFLPNTRIEFNRVPNQPSMLFKFNGSSYTNTGLPPSGWERGQARGAGPGVQVILKLPDGSTWPKKGDLEIHGIADPRGESFYSINRSMAIWDPGSKTFVIKTGYIHSAVDGGVIQGGELISYFKGEVISENENYGEVTIKYNRFINISIDGKAGEYQLFQRTLHMTNRVKKGTLVDIGTKIGNQGGVGANGRTQYYNHMHEEFFINTPQGKTLYLDPFIVYNYSYSRNSAGNRVFDSAARATQAATGSNNLNPGFQAGGKNQIGQQIILKTEFAGIPRALQILPGQTFLHFVTDYNRYVSITDNDRVNVDPGIPIIKQLEDWMIYRCSFNWSGDLRINVECYRPRTQDKIYAGQNWQSYRKNPGKNGPPLNDYYDYMRSIGDLSYQTLNENGEISNSVNTQLKADWLINGEGQGGNNTQPSIINGKCKYTGNTYSADKPFLDEVSAQLSNQGFNKIAISGILGNVSIESSFGKSLIGGPRTCEGADGNLSSTPISVTLPNGTNTSVPKGRCFGIVQWGGGRKISAINFIKGSGWTLSAHAAYVVKELRENEKTCQCNDGCKEFGKPMIDLLNNAKNAADAARIFRVCYERPSADDSQERQNEANTIFQGLTCE